MSHTKLLVVGVKKGRLKSHLVCCVIWFEDTLDKTIDKASKILGVEPKWIGICLPLTSEDLESLKNKILKEATKHSEELLLGSVNLMRNQRT